MCEPTTLAIIAGSASLNGGILKANAARAAGQAQGALLDTNARIAEFAAADAVDRGALAEGKIKLQGGQLEGHQKAQFAASGVDLQSGSALDVLSGTAGMTALEASIAKNNAAREARGFKTQASQFRAQAQLARDQGDAQATGSILGGIGGAAGYTAPLLKVK